PLGGDEVGVGPPLSSAFGERGAQGRAMVSYPGTARRVLAGLFMASGAAYTAAVKLTRGGSSALAPEWLAGVLPNLVCGAVVPLAAFLSGRAIRFRDFLLFDALVLAGLCAYEVAQLWMPRRTFEWGDLWASGA